MLTQFSIGKKLALAFGLVVLLQIVAGAESVRTLSDSSEGFADYRNLARETNLVGRVQANLLMVRLAVKDYLNTTDEEDLQVYRTRADQLNALFTQAREQASTPARTRLLADIAPLIEEYQQTFEDVIHIIEREHSIFYGAQSQHGREMLEALKQIAAAHPEHAYALSQLNSDVLLARLDMVKWFDKHQTEHFTNAQQLLTDTFDRHLQPIRSVIEAPVLAKLLQARDQYVQGMQQLAVIVKAWQTKVEQTLDVIGPKAASGLENVKLSVMKDQDTLGPEQQAANQTAIIILSVIIAIAVIVALLVAVLISRNIVRRLTNATRFAETMASGDLRGECSDNGSDEIHTMVQALNTMSASLKQMVAQISDSSEEINGSAARLGTLTEDSKANAFEQQSETEQVATAMNEMSATAHEVSSSAENVSSAASQAESTVQNGLSLVEDSKQNIYQLADSVKHGREQIDTLQKDAVSIGGILDVIRDIADQTNLLALNAAIEAARAGESGRGFAVVSDEVRSLALRTQQSITEIQGLIERLQNGANDAVSAMSEANTLTDSCVSLSEQSAGALEEISQSVVVVNQMIAQIATAAEEQSQVSEEINRNISNVSTLADKNASGTDEIAASSTQLSGLSANLRELVARFKY